VTQGRDWLATLPANVLRQQALLGRLLDEAEADERWRLLELSCSLARGAGDELSDIDVGLGAADGSWPELVAEIPALIGRLGSVVDSLRHDLGWNGPHERVFVQYADGTQLDLVVFAASMRTGLPPGAIALLDRDDVARHRWEPPVYRATDESLREWAFLGWVALANASKYLTRTSLWEALAQLDVVREQVWRLWAAAHDVEYPVFGLTSVLDEPSCPVPSGIEDTVARLDSADLLRAAFRLAELLEEGAGSAHPQPMAEHVTARLLALQGVSSRA
jgi:hypothetical protein